jgi:hypothetical protein
MGDRFWSKIDKKGKNECWNWIASTSTPGYGQFYSNGKMVGAHAFAYGRVKGKVPIGLEIRHSCDNRRCCNPAHMKVGTRKENASDREERNRGNHFSGEAHGRSKITSKEVLEIRSSSESSAQIAARYGISRSNVNVIRARKSWKFI